MSIERAISTPSSGWSSLITVGRGWVRLSSPDAFVSWRVIEKDDRAVQTTRRRTGPASAVWVWVNEQASVWFNAADQPAQAVSQLTGILSAAGSAVPMVRVLETGMGRHADEVTAYWSSAAGNYADGAELAGTGGTATLYPVGDARSLRILATQTVDADVGGKWGGVYLAAGPATSIDLDLVGAWDAVVVTNNQIGTADMRAAWGQK